jgi:molecular chaperone GrpE
VSEPAHQAPAAEGSETGHEPEQPDTAAELAEQLAEAEDRYRRALADLDNLRKRTSREIERRVEESRESLLRDWLEALDSVERALRMTPEGAVSTGLRSVLDQMEGILARYAVERIGQVGEPFDPERHEAVGVRESDQVPDRSVVDVARSGFAIGTRVLRPAQVIVSRRPEPEA